MYVYIYMLNQWPAWVSPFVKKVACVCALTHHRNLLPFWRFKSFGFCTSNSETHPVSECLSTKNINQINMFIYIYISYPNPSFLNICCTKFRFFSGETTVSFVFFGQLKFSQLRNCHLFGLPHSNSPGSMRSLAMAQKPWEDEEDGWSQGAIWAWICSNGQVCSNLLAIKDVDHLKDTSYTSMSLILQEYLTPPTSKTRGFWYYICISPRNHCNSVKVAFLFGPLASSASLFFQASKPTWLGGVEGAKKSTSTTLCWSGWNRWVVSKWFPMSEIFGRHSTNFSVWTLGFQKTFDVYLCRFGICFLNLWLLNKQFGINSNLMFPTFWDTVSPFSLAHSSIPCSEIPNDSMTPQKTPVGQTIDLNGEVKNSHSLTS